MMPWQAILARTMALGGLVASLVVLAGSATALARRADGHSDRFGIPGDADQLVVVSSPTYDPPAPGYLATLRTYERTNGSSRWRAVFTAWQAETGYGPSRDVRHEGDGSTPTGVFSVGDTMYGNDPDPGRLQLSPITDWRAATGGTRTPTRRTTTAWFMCRAEVTPPFASSSEALWTETVAYPYFAVVQFNAEPIVAGANAPGSGIFLHSWVGGPTAGCVALPKTELVRLPALAHAVRAPDNRDWHRRRGRPRPTTEHVNDNPAKLIAINHVGGGAHERTTVPARYQPHRSNSVARLPRRRPWPLVSKAPSRTSPQAHDAATGAPSLPVQSPRRPAMAYPPLSIAPLRFAARPAQQALFNAPEWTRTTTRLTPDKALNQI